MTFKQYLNILYSFTGVLGKQVHSVDPAHYEYCHIYRKIEPNIGCFFMRFVSACCHFHSNIHGSLS